MSLLPQEAMDQRSYCVQSSSQVVQHDCVGSVCSSGIVQSNASCIREHKCVLPCSNTCGESTTCNKRVGASVVLAVHDVDTSCSCCGGIQVKAANGSGAHLQVIISLVEGVDQVSINSDDVSRVNRGSATSIVGECSSCVTVIRTLNKGVSTSILSHHVSSSTADNAVGAGCRGDGVGTSTARQCVVLGVGTLGDGVVAVVTGKEDFLSGSCGSGEGVVASTAVDSVVVGNGRGTNVPGQLVVALVAVEGAGLNLCGCAIDEDHIGVQVALNNGANCATRNSDVVNTLAAVDSATDVAASCGGDVVGVLVAVDETAGQVESVDYVSALTTVNFNRVEAGGNGANGVNVLVAVDVAANDGVEVGGDGVVALTAEDGSATSDCAGDAVERDQVARSLCFDVVAAGGSCGCCGIENEDRINPGCSNEEVASVAPSPEWL